MSLDAGTIKGSIDLDTTSFQKGFSEAHTHAETEGGRIREVLESIAEIASEVVGPAFGHLGQEIQSAFAGFSEGLVIGTLNLIGVVLGNIREATVSTAERFDQIGLAAERAGVSTQFLGNLANIAQTVGVGVDQLSMGFKLLEERAAQAASGDKSATAAMAKVGISSAEAAELMSRPQELFERVKSSLEGMTNASERTAVSSQLLGRAGMALTPVMAMSAEQTDHLSSVFEQLGANVSESQAQLGKNASILETEFTAALKGIATAASQPILEYLTAHMPEIEAKIIQFSSTARTVIGQAWAFIKSESAELLPKLQAIGEEVATELGPVITKAAADFSEWWPVIKQVGGALSEDLQPILKQLIPLAGSVLGAFEALTKHIGNAFLDVLYALEPVLSRVANAIGNILGKVAEGFQIVGSVMGYYDDPNHGYGDATKAASGASSNDLRAQLRANGAVVSQAAQQQISRQIADHYTADVHANFSASTANVANAATGGSTAMEPFQRALQSTTDVVRELTDSFTRLNHQMQTRGTPSIAAGLDGSVAHSGHGAAGSTTQNFHLSVNHALHETVHMLAAQLSPMIRKAQKAIEDKHAGLALEMAARASMGVMF